MWWRLAPKREPQSDKCVLCGTTTDYLKDTPITERNHYIEGVGQLCTDCYEDLHLTGRRKDG